MSQEDNIEEIQRLNPIERLNPEVLRKAVHLVKIYRPQLFQMSKQFVIKRWRKSVPANYDEQGNRYQYISNVLEPLYKKYNYKGYNPSKKGSYLAHAEINYIQVKLFPDREYQHMVRCKDIFGHDKFVYLSKFVVKDVSPFIFEKAYYNILPGYQYWFEKNKKCSTVFRTIQQVEKPEEHGIHKYKATKYYEGGIYDKEVGFPNTNAVLPNDPELPFNNDFGMETCFVNCMNVYCIVTAVFFKTERNFPT